MAGVSGAGRPFTPPSEVAASAGLVQVCPGSAGAWQGWGAEVALSGRLV